MDEKQYAAAVDLCGRLTGRLPDGVHAVVRSYFAAGEDQLALATLLPQLRYDGVPVTPEEVALIRAVLEDPYTSVLAANQAMGLFADLEAVTAAAAPDVPDYRFSPDAPAGAPDPARTDVTAIAAAARISARSVARVWRDAGAATAEASTWVYIVHVSAGADPLQAFSSVSSVLWREARVDWPVDVVSAGERLTSYRWAAVAAARQLWAADLP